MSNQSNAGGGGCGSFSDRRPLAKRLDNSNFAQTCSLLSQFLKERRSLVDLRSDRVSTMKPRDDLEKPNPPPPPPSTANYSDDSRLRKDDLPKLVGFPPSGFSVNATNKGEFRRPATPEPATAQMTIFYAGKVMVYNDFPNERAKEIMALADKGSRSAAAAVIAVSPATAVSSASNKFASAVGKLTGNSPAVDPNVVAKSQSPVPALPAVEQQLPPQPAAKKSSDLPIARRASLHRFLEKRKDRAVAIAPYQVNQQPEAAFKASGSSSANEPELEREPEPEPQPEPEEDVPLQLDLNL